MKRTAVVWWGLGAMLCIVGALSLMTGAVPLAPADVWHALVGRGDEMTQAIVRTIRLPRTVLAACVGAALGVSGTVLQGTLRNALAEPYLLGVSGGAAVGAVLAVAAGVSAPPLIATAAFGGALLAVGVVLALARIAAGEGDLRLLMAGVVVGAFANAAIMVVMASADPNTTRNALWWMMGSVAAAGWRDVVLLSTVLLIVGGAALHLARALDVLALGGDTAESLGIRVSRVTMQLFVLASLLAAASVAAAGLVGFVGLMVPHFARSVTGGRSRAVLVAAALGGGALVTGADIVARVARAPAELPLGAITALVGVPFFLSRLRRVA